MAGQCRARTRILVSRLGSGTSFSKERPSGSIPKSRSKAALEANTRQSPPVCKNGSPSWIRCRIATPRAVKTRQGMSARSEQRETWRTSTPASLQSRSRMRALRNAALFSEDSTKIRGRASRQTTAIGTPGNPFPEPRSMRDPFTPALRMRSPAAIPSKKCRVAISEGSLIAVRFILLFHAARRFACISNSAN